MKPLTEVLSSIKEHGIDLEPLEDGSLLARIGGDTLPYDICVVVSRVDKETCEIKGLDKQPTLEQWKKLNEALKEHGFKYLIRKRVREL